MKYIWMLASSFFFMYSHGQSTDTTSPGLHSVHSIRDVSDATGASRDTAYPGSANHESHYTIGQIYITGNHKTKNYIILRELSFRTGDTLALSNLVQAFQMAHDRLINTHLFNDVVIFLRGFRGYIADIEIDVKERWYIFPVPYLRPVDRNFTAWAQTHYDLNRVDYGAKFTHYNFSGRNDQLTAWLITGYSRQFELFYNQPAADNELKHGFGFGFNFAEQKELNVATVYNKQAFVNADTVATTGNYLLRQFTVAGRYFYRPGLRVRHFFGFTLTNAIVDSMVTVLNPHYFNNNKREVLYPDLTYSINYTNVDMVSYPLNGIIFESGVIKRGLNTDVNMWLLYGKLTRSWPLAHKLWFGFQTQGEVKFPLSQPFYNQQLIGYSDFYIRGLDRYVVDGTAGFVLRNTLTREIFHFYINTPVKSHDHIPFRFYATLFSDYGYAYNRDFTANSLVNRFLYTAGVGIDLVTFYDLSLKFDYSVNQFGEKGLFLHIKNDF